MNVSVILTRPEHRNVALEAKLKHDGIRVLSLPALRLEASACDAQQMLWPHDFDLIVFVSSYAAQVYLDRVKSLCPAYKWPAGVRAATVGHASAKPLYRADLVPDSLVLYPEQEQHTQDSEGLWQVLKPALPTLKKVLIVRGQVGREWLGSQFEKYNISLTRLSLYRREPVIWQGADVHALTEVLNEPEAPVFLLTSSDSVNAVHANIQRLDLMSEWAQCRFVVIHERILAHLQSILQVSGLDARQPITICAPCDDAIYQTIYSLVSHPQRL